MTLIKSMKITDPAFNYDKFGQGYSGVRKTDPGIAEYVNKALGNAKTVLNVGAGSGSYEPEDRYVIAVEPSEVMRAQRVASGKSPAVIAKADSLPFDDNSFDASMAMLTVHHWHDMAKGLNEMKRVTKHRIVIMTFDPDALDDFWIADYAPELMEVEKARDPSIDFIKNTLGGKCEVWKIPVGFNCTDGFQEAFFGKPEAFLQKEVRMSQSAWGFLDEETENRIVKRLADDLESGEWDRKYGKYRKMKSIICALRLVISSKQGGGE